MKSAREEFMDFIQEVVDSVQWAAESEYRFLATCDMIHDFEARLLAFINEERSKKIGQ